MPLLLPAATFRAPSVPLVAHDPYFSVWSPADRLADADTVHWTGKAQPLVSLVRIDAATYRLLGAGEEPALPQTRTEVTPTRTIATYEGRGIRLTLTFTTPTLPDDLDVLSRPATYVSWRAVSADGRPHRVAAYFEASARLAVNTPDQTVDFRRERFGPLTALSTGTVAQPVLQKKGDDLRIDWGRAYLAASGGDSRIGSAEESRRQFEAGRKFGAEDLAARPAGDGKTSGSRSALAVALEMGAVGERAVERHAIVAYDDVWSIEYFGQRLRPYWRRKGMAAPGMLQAAERDYAKLTARCEAFDRELLGDMERAGGANYAYLGALAYRQAFAAQKLVADPNGAPLLFPKENFSNGCIATVDVIYPAAPLTLLFSPALTRASLQPALAYASSPRWKWPFAPHDLGQYPKANGQVYGGGERTEEDQMPVEETGNLLILLAALAKMEGNANFCGPYWPTLRRWAAFLAEKGFDPERQLSTDDFAGHLAHNVNLSVKAIEALGAYAQLAAMHGDRADAAKYGAMAREFAGRWVRESEEGDHTRLAFDKPETWSQKYNLVWDRPLGLNLFPPSVAQREAAYYRTKLHPYGLPLDSRADYTKLDWTVWSATLTGRRDDFDALVAPTIAFLGATPDRIPMTDWHETSRPKHVGFQARSVVGGVFVKLLDDPAVWRKWVSRDHSAASGWAPLPARPVFTLATPTARTAPATWRYRFDVPSDGWTAPGYDDSGWREGKSGFGTEGTPGATIGTKWDTGDIWLRRTFDLPRMKNPRLWVHHDEDAEIWINGVRAATLPGYVSDYEPSPISPAALRALRVGKNVVAIHVRQTQGGQFIDLAFAEAK